MPTIRNDKTATVLVLCDCKPGDIEEATRLAKEMIPVFAKQPGFVSASLHVSEKRDRFVQYLQWRTVADHLACQKSEDWKAPGASAFWRLMQEGKVKVDAQVYDVAAVLDGPA